MSSQQATRITGFFPEITFTIKDFLEKALPKLSENWWSDYVIKMLTYNQQRIVEQKQITNLNGFDLAALLRIFDRNWSELAYRCSLLPSGRNYLKEVQDIRNRYSHADSDTISIEDLYRDLDTMERFIRLINPDNTTVQNLQEEKQKLNLVKEQNFEKINDVDKPIKQSLSSGFTLGQIVFLKSNQKKSGAVVGIHPDESENRYDVFVDNKIMQYYESQLLLQEQPLKICTVLPLAQFHARVSALQIQHPGLSTLYSLNAARIDFIPYQFRPVLKFIKSDRPRLLIADGVGVGKTIEAGLILKELEARQEIKSVLIICPRPLVTERKWAREMDRFDHKFTHLDGKTLRYCIEETDLEGEWPLDMSKIIVPYSLFDEILLLGRQASGRKLKMLGLLNLDPPPQFDLVIVDESHHIKNPATYAHQAVRFFCDNAKAVVFLTATPIQLGDQDLFVQLNVLRPDLIIDKESFAHMAEPNPFINSAVNALRAARNGWQKEAYLELQQASATDWGRKMLFNDPEFKRISNLLSGREITKEERVATVNDVEQLHTFSTIINRTRRRDIDEFTIRKPQTVTVEFTPEQQELHDSLLRVQATILSCLHADVNINFLMTTIKRQAASCLFGLVPLLNDILTRRLDELTILEIDDLPDMPDMGVVSKIEDQILEVLTQAERLDCQDPKFEALHNIVKDKQVMENNRIMIFSSFRHTLSYLFEKLVELDVRVGVVHGGTPDEERVQLRRRFKMAKEHKDSVDVLLFSEIGCEGLDYQFCDCLINYDLPWNPMKIEQRIGRIDRNGQKSEGILIYNFVTPGTVDADIYERCLVRIGIFNSAIGAGEEILGEIAKKIHDVVSDSKLNSHERAAKLQQLADNEIRLIQEQNQLEDQQADLFGIKLPFNQAQQEIDNATSYWLSPQAIENLVDKYLKFHGDENQEYLLGEKPLRTVRVNLEMRKNLFADYKKLMLPMSKNNKQWRDWLKGNNPHFSVTFDTACAVENLDVALLTPLHPLVKQAAKSLEPDSHIRTALEVWTDKVPEGEYPFALYQWQLHGIRDDLLMYLVCESEQLREKLPDFLEHGRTFTITSDSFPSEEVFEKIGAKHYQLWLKKQQIHKEHSNRTVEYKKESLRTSFESQMAVLRDQFSHANNEKIRKMRQSQIDTAKLDYERCLEELNEAAGRADITTMVVALGVVKVNKIPH